MIHKSRARGRRRYLRFNALIVVGIVASLWGWRVAHAESLTLDEYRLRLLAARSILAASTAEGAAGALARAQADLGRIESVRPSGGDLVHLTPLIDGVTEPRVALARLNAAVEQMNLATSDNFAQRQAILARILERPAFGGPTLWERFLDWLRRVLGNAVPEDVANQATSPATSAAGELLSWALVVAGLTAVILLVAYWIQRIYRDFAGDAALRRRFAGGVDGPQTSVEARALASTQAASGSFRLAVRSLYLSALLLLEENAMVVANRTLTNRELLSRSSANEEVRTRLSNVVDTFDAVWYGVREPDALHFAAYERQIDGLRVAVEQSREGGEEKPA